MRTSILVAAAVLGLSAPAFAQDRTIPAGDFHGVEAPIDWQRPDNGPVSLYQGRSVVDQPVMIQHSKHLHHRS